MILRLGYRPPLAWEALLAYLAPRAIPGVEQIAAGTYRRTVRVDDASGVLEVAHDPERRRLVLRAPMTLAPHVARLVARTRAQFDLDADPGLLAAHLDADPLLAGRPAGLRVPGAWDPFELAVRAILGQQITVAAATRLAGRLVRAFGRPLDTGDDALGWVFPAGPGPRPGERRRHRRHRHAGRARRDDPRARGGGARTTRRSSIRSRISKRRSRV